jgi:citrate synthase
VRQPEFILENVAVRGIKTAMTRISSVDGENGTLLYRGYRIEDLAARSTFEEVAYLLIHGAMPNDTELREFSDFLIRERNLPDEMIAFLLAVPRRTPPMAVLQSGISLLSGFCPDLKDGSLQATRRKAGRLLAKIPTLICAWDRIRNGWEPLAPDADLSHAANYLYMLRGERPTAADTAGFDTVMIVDAEHSFNASVITARLVASNHAPLYACISAAVGSLSGERHGGANLQVMRNLIEIGDPARVEGWVVEQFDQRRRFVGMGHPVYRKMDPRAKIFRELAERIAKGHGGAKWYAMTGKMAEVSQREFKKRSGDEIYPNADLYSASTYYMLGIPIDLFTPVFASARSAGWLAHLLEEIFPDPPVKPVVYHPSAFYTGEYCGEPERPYIPLEKRE